MQPLFELIQESLNQKISTSEALERLKHTYCEKYKLKSILNIDLIQAYRELLSSEKIQENKQFYELIKKRNIRSQSGVSVVTVFTKPFACPGKCIFCPTEPDMPKSYLSKEPGIQRAVLNHWSGYDQVQNRLRSLDITGHTFQKNELIISGGTWSYYPKKYQTAFVKSCYDGFNTFEEVLFHTEYSPLEQERYAKFTVKKHRIARAKNLEEAKKINETTLARIIGMSVETRPDFITKAEVKRIRNLGCTRIQLGVQSTDDLVLELNKRGHGIKETIEATKLCRDAGLKIDYHMMPNLYGSTPEKDRKMFYDIIENPGLRPDQLKIYPTSVVPYSELERIYRAGKYEPYSEEELFDILYEMKQMIPPYIRISRLIRDIPGNYILGGSKRTNMRQLLQDKLEKEGKKCRCIRCREVRDRDPRLLSPELTRLDFEANEGKEVFFSFEDTKEDVLFGFCRLRFPSYLYSHKKHFIPDLQDAALVRELHVYGLQVPVDTQEPGVFQHFGFGKKLMRAAEEEVQKQGVKKLAVISGIGVREYYRKIGYVLEGEYMVKYF